MTLFPLWCQSDSTLINFFFLLLFSSLFFLSASAPAKLKCYYFQIFILKENDDRTSSSFHWGWHVPYFYFSYVFIVLCLWKIFLLLPGIIYFLFLAGPGDLQGPFNLGCSVILYNCDFCFYFFVGTSAIHSVRVGWVLHAL